MNLEKLEITGAVESGAGAGATINDPVALLFLIIDDFPYEHIWLKWAENNPKIQFFFHAKNEDLVRSPFVKSRLVRRRGDFPAPEWGTINLTKAMVHLLNNAGQFSSAVFLSESCLPIMPVDEFLYYVKITGEKSWMKLFTEPNDQYSDTYQFKPLWLKYTKKNVGKCDQWIMLSYKHAQIICATVKQNPSIWSSFENLRASDEMFFPTLLAIALGGIEKLRAEIIERRITMVDWTEHKANPKTFTHLTPELVNICLRDFGSAFIRKIKLPCQVAAAAEGKSCTRQRAQLDKKQLYIEWLVTTKHYSQFFATIVAGL
jgi:hypothetical protein